MKLFNLKLEKLKKYSKKMVNCNKECTDIKNNIILDQTYGLVFTEEHNIDIKKEFNKLLSNYIGENYEF